MFLKKPIVVEKRKALVLMDYEFKKSEEMKTKNKNSARRSVNLRVINFEKFGQWHYTNQCRDIEIIFFKCNKQCDISRESLEQNVANKIIVEVDKKL